MKKHLVWFLLCLHYFVYAQNTIGLPDIKNYTKQQYNGASQTWDVQCDSKGMMYFANNDGLLAFNGTYWKTYPIPNKTCLRSIAIDKYGKIYAGAQDEIGYFFPNKNGELKYTSLKKLIPEKYRQFADIWNVVVYGESIFFRTADKMFELKDNAIKTYLPSAEWRFLCKTKTGLYAQELKEGLLKYNNGNWQKVNEDFAKKDMLITAIMDGNKDTLNIATLKDGLYTLSNNTLTFKPTAADNIFRTNRIYCASTLPDGNIAIGTTSTGCYIINQKGKIIQSFSITEGLQNNNVLKIFVDVNQNLWLALDYGIDLIKYNTPIKHIYPDKNNLLTSYATQIFDNRLYVGTSDGLYSTSIDGQEADISYSRSPFVIVNNTKGQTWNLSEVNMQLLLGHHEGTFIIKNNTATPLLKNVGSWLYYPLTAVFPSNKVITGTYTGLHLLNFNNNNFTDGKQLQGLSESLRFVAIDNDNVVWASHPYRGIYKIDIRDSVIHYQLFTKKDGLPSDLNNYIYRIKNRVVTATDKGIYEYDPSTNKCIKSPLLFDILGNISVNYLREDNAGNIWFVSNKRLGVIDFQKPLNGKPYSIIYFPELAGKLVGGFEYIYPYNSENIFIGAEKGVYHLNYKKYSKTPTSLQILLGQVKAIGKKDSLIFGGYFADESKILAVQSTSQKIQLPYTYNSFHFEFSSPSFGRENSIEYSYKLVGFDKSWSEWTNKTEKEYTNLPYGNYTFMVKARNNIGNETAPISFSVTINPPWYKSIYAYLFYALFFVIANYMFFKMQRKKFALQKIKHANEQEHLRYMHQLEIDRNEKELIKLQNDKLETEVEFKNKELASATMHLVERGKVLSKIKEELVQTLKKADININGNFKRVIRLLDEAENNEDDWDHFATHFDQVHSNFLVTLKNKFPQLTATDLKLCAYLRMNLSSKEIAQLMSISLRGVEISRYRLRKKLALTGDTTLFDFLIAVAE